MAREKIGNYPGLSFKARGLLDQMCYKYGKFEALMFIVIVSVLTWFGYINVDNAATGFIVVVLSFLCVEIGFHVIKQRVKKGKTKASRKIFETDKHEHEMSVVMKSLVENVITGEGKIPDVVTDAIVSKSNKVKVLQNFSDIAMDKFHSKLWDNIVKLQDSDKIEFAQLLIVQVQRSETVRGVLTLNKKQLINTIDMLFEAYYEEVADTHISVALSECRDKFVYALSADADEFVDRLIESDGFNNQIRYVESDNDPCILLSIINDARESCTVLPISMLVSIDTVISGIIGTAKKLG